MKVLFLVTVCLLHCSAASTQGCSDAGFCTAGALHPSAAAADSIQRTSWKLGLSLSVAKGERSTMLVIPQVEIQYSPRRNMQLEVRLPLYYANGLIGAHSGIGDPIVTVSNQILVRKSWLLKSTAGVRVSLGRADAASDLYNRPLPMPYQSNLGTTDLIAGLSLIWKKYLSIAAGLQQPVFQYNNNGYNAASYSSEPEGYGSYFSSRKLRRKGDALLRADASYMVKRWSISAGPLLIVHLGKDRISDAAGQEMPVDGSDGATLNITGTLGYKLSKSRIELVGGSPLMVRKVRPDGLTRSSIITLRYEHYFR